MLSKWSWIFGVVIVLIVAVVFVPRNCRETSNYPQEGLKYHGNVEDCCCSYETLDTINNEVLHTLLQEIVKRPFFRYFKCDCPFWPDDGMCRLRDCTVCECPENEFPESFRKPSGNLSPEDLVCQEGNPQASVDRTIEGFIGWMKVDNPWAKTDHDAKAFKGWMEVDNLWTNDDETDHAELTYVNLQLNPERYTGYTGPSARRIWDAIYLENCQKYQSGDCQEKRMLFKLISGLHSSISIHIAADYLLYEKANIWGQNLPLLYNRVLKFPDRVRNLYVTFLLVLRSVIKDLHTHLMLQKLVYDFRIQAACPKPFDEAKLWKGQSGPELFKQIQGQFKNMSAMIGCVGCEKCRLWGKLQFLGLETALKILFSVNDQEISSGHLQLQRTEVIALINLLTRLSVSVKFVHEIVPSIIFDRTFGKIIISNEP